MATTDGTTPAGSEGEPDVLDAPDYLPVADAPRPPRSTPWLVAAALVVLVVIGVAVVAVTRSPDETATPPSTTVPSPTTPDQDDAGLTEIRTNAPYDGKASMRLPITVTPNRDLVDGQTVTVSGTGFPPGADVGVLMCTNDAVFGGIAACDIGTAMSSISMTNSKITADANGSFSVPYRVRLHFRVADPHAVATPPTSIDPYGNVIMSGAPPPMRQIDCGAGDIDPDLWPNVIPLTAESEPVGFTCIIAAGMVTDYDKSGGAAIGVAGSQFRTFEPSQTHARPTVAPPVAPEPSTTTSLAGPTPAPATSAPPPTSTYPPHDASTTTTTGPPPGTSEPPLPPGVTTTAPGGVP